MFVADGRRRVVDLVVDPVHDPARLTDAFRVPGGERIVAVAGTEHTVVASGPRPDLEYATERFALARDAEPAEFGRRMELDDDPIVARRTPATMTLHSSTRTY